MVFDCKQDVNQEVSKFYGNSFIVLSRLFLLSLWIILAYLFIHRFSFEEIRDLKIVWLDLWYSIRDSLIRFLIEHQNSQSTENKESFLGQVSIKPEPSSFKSLWIMIYIMKVLNFGKLSHIRVYELPLPK